MRTQSVPDDEVLYPKSSSHRGDERNDLTKPTVEIDGVVKEPTEFNGMSVDALKGKTLDIYYYLVKNPGYHGVRDVQRTLQYSSPSLAAYHLNRLLEAKVVLRNDAGQYAVISESDKLGTLEEYVKIVKFWIPKTAIYALFLLVLGVGGIIFVVIDAPVTSWAVLYIPSTFALAIMFIRDGLKLSEKLTA
ncbi:MAG: hypothetical protein GPJ54_04065 [Candidatus Heimdallarchaeota archaeon]|nr:hypothetical protein [Candidatus Heimdallarchaeota archaeon]